MGIARKLGYAVRSADVFRGSGMRISAPLAAPFSKIDEPGPSSCDFYQRSGNMAVV